MVYNRRMKPASKQNEMRHEPIQARSAQRVAHILDVASKLISEVGYDRATTNDIAKLAGVPIGSLYQYFPNKHALLHALSTRYLSQLRDYFVEQKIITDSIQLHEFLSSIIDTLVEFRKSHRSFKQMFLGIYMNNEVSIAAKTMNEEFRQIILKKLEIEKPELSAKRRERVSYVLFGMIRSVFVYLSVIDDTMWKEMKEETKFAIRTYLSAV